MNEKMPKIVKVALALCLLTILITAIGPMIHEGVFIKHFLEYASGHDHRMVGLFGSFAKIVGTLIGSFLGIIMFCALAYGKSWARKTYIVLFMLVIAGASCGMLAEKVSSFSRLSRNFQWWDWANLAIDAVVVALFYFHSARTWFKGDAIPENKWKNRFQCLLFWFLLLAMEFAAAVVGGIAIGIEQCGKWRDKYPHIRVAQLKARADQGDAPSMWRLGNWERNGWLGEKHPDKAVAWYQKAADLGDVCALNDLGDCYDKGIGTETNTVKAIECWTKASEKRHGWAACKVALRHQKDKKTDEAFAWFRKAADIGSDYACCKLGECYERGWGTETNAVEAAKGSSRVRSGIMPGGWRRPATSTHPTMALRRTRRRRANGTKRPSSATAAKAPRRSWRH